jgi:hypothetical protein
MFLEKRGVIEYDRAILIENSFIPCAYQTIE